MSQNLFNSIKLSKPKSNVFDLSHDVKLSLNMGQLVPIMCLEAVPGDKFNISCESLLRFAPMVSPVMHRMDVTMHYFFVPNRLVWRNWETWITNTLNGGTLPDFPVITMGLDLSGGKYSALCDYMGIPTPLISNTEDVSAIPFSAYQMVYNEYYRDQNLISPVDFALNDGNNTSNYAALLSLRLRAWQHDYFTAALPFAQKNAAVTVPVGEVFLKDDWSTSGTPLFENVSGLTDTGNVSQTGAPHIELSGAAGGAQAYDPDGTLGVESGTINDLRRAFRLQEWLEKAARGGSRYVESILSHFAVKSSDKRLQRPEYITGTKSPVSISEIVNTTGTDDLPQGNMAGHGVSVTTGKYGNYFCEEHGYIIGVMSVMPKSAYMQGIEKHWLKHNDPFEFYWPSFANIGEQPVENREIFAFQGATGDDTFGYVPRYAEYKFMNSRVAGDFRTSLDFWHLGRKFASAPALNQDFVEMKPANGDRIFAVTDPAVQKLYAHVLNKVRAVRRMPKFGNPQF